MILLKHLFVVSMLFVLGCSQTESASDTISNDDNSPMMVDGDHTHYHVHGAEIAHDHTHDQAKSTAHTHEHLHHRESSEKPITDPKSAEK